MFLNPFRTRLYRSPDDPQGGAPAETGAGTPPVVDPPASGEKTFTQAELDALIAKRYDRMKAQATQEAKAALEAESKQAQMTEAERLKAEKDAIEQRANTLVESANKRLILADAKAAALAAGIKPDRIDAALRLADLSGVTVDESGTVDGEALTPIIAAIVAQYPEWKTGTSGPAAPAGQTFNGGNEPPSLDKQIAEAQGKGDAKTMVALINRRGKLGV